MITRALLKKLSREAYDKQNGKLPEDVSEVDIDLSQSIEERKLQYLKKIQNPYRFRHGQVKIHVKYAPDEPSINKLLARYFEHKS